MQAIAEREITLRPIGEQVIVELLEGGDRESAGGIIIPEIASRGEAVKTERARVMVAGPGRISRKGALLSPEVQPGQEVLIYRSMGTEMVSGSRRLVIINPKDILAVLNESA
jgi:co-chaperonin GroES (HSP10)